MVYKFTLKVFIYSNNGYLGTTVFMLSTGTDRPEQTVDADQMLHSAESVQGLHCLPLMWQFTDDRGTDR